MLIRGCTIAMRRVPVGEVPDHLTINLVQKVLELWGDMQAVGRKPDYLTYIELLRAFGKGGQLPQAIDIFEYMCSKVTLLPEQRAFDSMYEVRRAPKRRASNSEGCMEPKLISCSGILSCFRFELRHRRACLTGLRAGGRVPGSTGCV